MKQRAEIVKLRRALRDSLSGLVPPTSSSSSALLNLPLNSPLTPYTPSQENLENGLITDYFEEEIEDPELELRWDKISEMVGNMLRKGEEAVLKGCEEFKMGQRVLGWMDTEGHSFDGQEEVSGEVDVESEEDGDGRIAGL